MPLYEIKFDLTATACIRVSAESAEEAERKLLKKDVVDITDKSVILESDVDTISIKQISAKNGLLI